MPKFELEKIESVKGKQKFEQLSVDGVLPLDEFEKDLADTTYQSEYEMLTAYMNWIADLKGLPENKFREIKTSKNDTVKEYELKTKHLRLYMFKGVGGKIVVLGGYKNTQKGDIKRFKSLKSQYLKSISTKS